LSGVKLSGDGDFFMFDIDTNRYIEARQAAGS